VTRDHDRNQRKKKKFHVRKFYEKKWEEGVHCSEDDHKSVMEKARSKALAPIWAKFQQNTLRHLFGDSEEGRKLAAYVAAVHYDQPMPEFDKKEQTGQTQSNPVKPENEV